MAGMLPVIEPSRLLESPNGSLPGNGGHGRHQMGTSTARTSTIGGIPLAARAARQPEIASRMCARASVSVLPCDTHPGIAGHSATIMPVSSGSNVTRGFIVAQEFAAREDYGGCSKAIRVAARFASRGRINNPPQDIILPHKRSLGASGA